MRVQLVALVTCTALLAGCATDTDDLTLPTPAPTQDLWDLELPSVDVSDGFYYIPLGGEPHAYRLTSDVPFNFEAFTGLGLQDDDWVGALLPTQRPPLDTQLPTCDEASGAYVQSAGTWRNEAEIDVPAGEYILVAAGGEDNENLQISGSAGEQRPGRGQDVGEFISWGVNHTLGSVALPVLPVQTAQTTAALDAFGIVESAAYIARDPYAPDPDDLLFLGPGNLSIHGGTCVDEAMALGFGLDLLFGARVHATSWVSGGHFNVTANHDRLVEGGELAAVVAWMTFHAVEVEGQP